MSESLGPYGPAALMCVVLLAAAGSAQTSPAPPPSSPPAPRGELAAAAEEFKLPPPPSACAPTAPANPPPAASSSLPTMAGIYENFLQPHPRRRAPRGDPERRHQGPPPPQPVRLQSSPARLLLPPTLHDRLAPARSSP